VSTKKLHSQLNFIYLSKNFDWKSHNWNEVGWKVSIPKLSKAAQRFWDSAGIRRYLLFVFTNNRKNVFKVSQGETSIFLYTFLFASQFSDYTIPRNTTLRFCLCYWFSLQSVSIEKTQSRGILHWSSSQFKIDCFQLSAAVVNERARETSREKRKI
jgi:hypothetical protein